MRIRWKMQTTGDPPRGTYFLLVLESLRGNVRNNQPTIALSIREAEYMTTSHYTKEVVWLRQLLADVGYVQERPTSIMYDNQECTTLVKNPTHHSYTKHINVQHQFIKEKLENQDICLKYCPTEDMIADVLIKPLAKDRIKH